jgi:type II secretory ATPase GspE/PulE/Tfp pilus assembly ATPase PilB-like protein
MASPPDDHDRSDSLDSVRQNILFQFQGDWVDRLNVDQMFILIDGVLPFEVCLYYQVLPLFVEGSRLNLGMVSPDDTTASEYVRRFVSYLNYSLFPRRISSEALRVSLTSYLNYTGTQQATSTQHQQTFSYGHHRRRAKTRAERQIDQNDLQTLVVDSPEELNSHSSGQAIESTAVPPSPEIPLFPQSIHQEQADSLSESDTNTLQNSEQPLAELQLNQTFPFHLMPGHSLQEQPSIVHPLPSLQLKTSFLSSPIDVLISLPPAELLQELLARVLLGGIGRLFFERHPQYGRVLWSQNGILQSVLERLPPLLLQGLIDELKRMAQVSLGPIREPKQVEIEYLYERTRILLRFRFMSNGLGEEATLQVLRGAALKFYQRQQVSQLERDALSIAKQLQSKLNEIRDRTDSSPNLLTTRFEVLPALSQLLHSIEVQLENLGVNRSPEEHQDREET